MATSSQDPQMQVDNLPLSTRRKRRSSSVHSQHQDPVNSLDLRADANGLQERGRASKTPAKPKKRVRFSDPGPATSPQSPMSTTHATGLTPFMSRTSFESRARDARDSSPPLRPQARRRLSLATTSITALPSPSLSPSPLSPIALSGEVQFFPIRQTLDARARRRLRRNNLSEEMNNIEAEKKSIDAQWRRELKELKDENALLRERTGSVDPGRIRQLEEELNQFKQENSQHPASLHDVTLDQNSGIFMDETAGYFGETGFDEEDALQDQTPVVVSTAPEMNHATTQADVEDPVLRHTLREARISLENLIPGETSLGFVGDDPKPLLDAMLEKLEMLKTQVLVVQDALSRNQTQESNLRTQFNAVLEQLNRSRQYAEKVAAKHANERARAESAQAKLNFYEQNATNVTQETDNLRQECADRLRSNQKLQVALDSYRIEVGKLEELINRMESDQNEAVSAVRSEMDEAVADLECTVAAETRGRREAEAEVVQRDARIAELRSREEQLLSTIHAKESIIQDLEAASHCECATHEQETSDLNVQIVHLSSDLEESKAQLQQHQAQLIELKAERTKAERTADFCDFKRRESEEYGKRSMADVRSTVLEFSSKITDLTTAHELETKRRGAEVDEHKGLLTPVAFTRFRDVDSDCDVDGHIEMGRGDNHEFGVRKKRKRRPDSGIGVLEEDQDDGDGLLDMM